MKISKQSLKKFVSEAYQPPGSFAMPVNVYDRHARITGGLYTRYLAERVDEVIIEIEQLIETLPASERTGLEMVIETLSTAMDQIEALDDLNA